MRILRYVSARVAPTCLISEIYRALRQREFSLAEKLSQTLDRLPPIYEYDHSEFGDVEVMPLPKIQSIGGQMLARNWVAIPHVTHHDDIDISDIEKRRSDWNKNNPNKKLTILIPMMKAMAKTLASHPKFNASITPDGASIVLKKYYNIGVAVDTPNGLLVPVIRDCDSKENTALAAEVLDQAEKARSKGLSLDEMSGSSITITSLGHIGGTMFTPIINAPDVAILGVTRAKEVCVRNKDNEPEWRTFLPLSLSYDHRVINGSDAAHF